MPVTKYQEFIPHTVLQNHVKRFWILEKQYTAEDSREEVLPDACIELILNFGSAYVQIEETGAQRELPEVSLIGLQRKPLIFQSAGLVRVVAVRFFAWGPWPFLTNKLEPGHVKGLALAPAWLKLVAKMKAKVLSGDYEKAVQEIEDFFISKRLNALFEPQQIQAAAKLLYHTKGQFRVAELADRCHTSARQLERQFDGATGVSPKALARAIRFDAIRSRLMFKP